MIPYLCPHCGNVLLKNPTSYRCEKNHCFDQAKQGYVNLLCAKNRGNHGDDKGMVSARCAFLDTNAYLPFCDTVCSLLNTVSHDDFSVLDAGCGEGYYTTRIHEALTAKCNALDIHGLDVSKNAVIHAAKRNKQIQWSVGSVYALPYPSSSFSAIVSLFSPFARDEFLRVLQEKGYLLMGIPLEDHLWELKSAIYDSPYKNRPSDEQLDGFRLLDRRELRYCFSLEGNEMIQNLFAMTPYAYNTSPKDRNKLNLLSRLEITAHFAVLLYQKNL